MTDFSGFSGFKNLIMNFKQQVIESKKQFMPDGEMCVDKETFYKDNPKADKSIFSKLDFDNDGYISQREYLCIKLTDTNNDGVISDEEAQKNKQDCMEEALFFARRNIDKWFTVDVDRDGRWSNVETEMGEYRMAEICDDPEHIMDSSMSNEELAQKYMMNETINDGMSMEEWIDGWLDYIKTDVAHNMYGVDLTPNDMAVLKAECLKQLNTWLFKTGDNKTKNAPLYNSLNVTAYTRLMTRESAVSCCGGDITPPPMADRKDACSFVFSPLEYTPEQYEEAERNGEDLDESLKNDAKELKNRLAWAAFPLIPKEKLSDNSQCGTVWMNFSDEEYSKLHEQWEKIRNTSAAELREMLNPLNEFKRRNFEANTIMSVAQMVQFIDIVEAVTGHSWDDEDWEVTAEQFYNICERVNDTAEDSSRLDGKTCKDIPENRQKLREFLEEKGWLNEQFKENPKEEKTESVQEYWQNNDKNKMVYDKEINKAARKILSNIEQAKIKETKEKELEKMYNPKEYEWFVEINKYGDLHWAVRKRDNA